MDTDNGKLLNKFGTKLEIVFYGFIVNFIPAPIKKVLTASRDLHYRALPSF